MRARATPLFSDELWPAQIEMVRLWPEWRSGTPDDSAIIWRTADRRSRAAPVSRITNSSPPTRAILASGPAAAVSRSATATISASPASWPAMSFVCFRKSISMAITSMPELRVSGCSSMFWNRARLPRPVSASVVATRNSVSRSASAASASRRSWRKRSAMASDSSSDSQPTAAKPARSTRSSCGSRLKLRKMRNTSTASAGSQPAR